VERAQAVVPERAVAGLEEGAPAVELIEVEEELDLDVSFIAGEVAEAAGEGGGVERGRGERVHERAPPSELPS
jgi:hypothetical protein